MDGHAGAEFFRGAWGWFAVVVVLTVFDTVLGEELLSRGLLLPRMRGPSEGAIPSILADVFLLAYPSRRFQSAWMGIVVHATQSVFFVVLVLIVVLR